MADALSVARPYAKAAFSVAKADNQLSQWSHALKQLAIASQEKDMQALLKNPNVSKEQCCELLRVFADAQSLQNFLKLLAEKKRLPLLPDVSILFETMLAKESGYLALTVTSAFEMSETQQNEVQKKLETQFHSAMKIEFKVDPSVIGGLFVRSDTWVMDATILGKLKRLKTVLN
ncbi:MAG: F0F1 ATP synthase subunit delta [Coxiellaceae bacterium]|nr:F0F1 ATP synthase subunit delta [Coxiellaceae bacterium]